MTTSNTDLQPWIFAFSIFQFLVTSGVGIYAYRSSKEKVTNARFEAQDKRIVQIEADIKLDAANSKKELELSNERHQAIVKRLDEINKEVGRHSECKHHQGFEDRLDAMNGSINKLEGVVEGRMEGIGSALDMIQQHLLSGGK